MKAKRIVLSIVLVMSLALGIPLGTSCLGDSGGGGGGDVATEVIDMLKMMPKGADDFMSIDLEALRADDDFEELYNDFMSDLSDLEESFGISFGDVSLFGVSGDGEIVILRGDFDFDGVRDALEEIRLEEETYEGVEMWVSPGISVALMDDMIIFGGEDNVKDCIEVIEEGDDSLYDNADFRDVIDRLPDGVMVAVGEGGSVMDYEAYDGLKVTGVSIAKHSSDSVRFTGIAKFEDGDAAEDAIDDLREDMETDEDELRNIDVSRDGEYLEGTAERDIEGLLSDDGNGS